MITPSDKMCRICKKVIPKGEDATCYPVKVWYHTDCFREFYNVGKPNSKFKPLTGFL